MFLLFMMIKYHFTGLTADSKTLIDRARVESQNHWFTYDEKMQACDILLKAYMVLIFSNPG